MFEKFKQKYREWEERQLTALVRKIRGDKPPDIKALLADPEFRKQLDESKRLSDAHFRVNDLEETVRYLESRLKTVKDWGQPVIAHRDLHGTLSFSMENDDSVFWTYRIEHPESGDEILLTMAHRYNPGALQQFQQQVHFSVVRINKVHGFKSHWRFNTNGDFEHESAQGSISGDSRALEAARKRLVRLFRPWTGEKLPLQMPGSKLSEVREHRREQAVAQIPNGIHMVLRRLG